MQSWHTEVISHTVIVEVDVVDLCWLITFLNIFDCWCTWSWGTWRTVDNWTLLLTLGTLWDGTLRDVPDDSSGNTNISNWKLEEVGLGWDAWLIQLPFLLDGNLVNNSLLLLNEELSPDIDVNESDLWDLNSLLVGWDDLSDFKEVDLWDANWSFECRSDLLDSDVVNLWEDEVMLLSDSL